MQTFSCGTSFQFGQGDKKYFFENRNNTFSISEFFAKLIEPHIDIVIK